MTGRSQRKKIEASRCNDFYIVAENFYQGAKVASDYAYYNAAGVLIVHSAIAYSDAICIKNKGVKIQGENHYEVISLLDDIITHSEEKKKALNHLKNIIDHKNSVSYSGEVYHKKDIESLWKQLDRFKFWAEQLLR